MKLTQSNIAYAIVILWLLGMVFLCARITNAQSSVATWVMVDCVERIDDTYRMHFGYRSDGVEEFVVTLQAAEGIPATLNAPAAFTTVPGVWLDWYLEIDAEYAAYTFTVIFENGSALHRTPFRVNDMDTCDVGEYQPEHTEPVNLRWATDSASGQPYTYVPVSSGVVPLPPVYGGV